MAPQTLREWLASGPFALCLCSSFFGFYAHAGALQALIKEGLPPAPVTGSSSGSVIAALYAGGLDARTTLPALLFKLRSSDILTPFWRSPSCWVHGGFFRINQEFLARNAPVACLQDSPTCPVAISTYNTVTNRTEVHTSGPTSAVVAASCAIPAAFQKVQLNGVAHVDGGVGDLLALASCSPRERVLSIDLHTAGLEGARQSLGARAEAQRRAAGQPVLEQCVRLQIHGGPFIQPLSMRAKGPLGFAAGKGAMAAALAAQGDWGGERIHKVMVPSA